MNMIPQQQHANTQQHTRGIDHHIQKTWPAIRNKTLYGFIHTGNRKSADRRKPHRLPEHPIQHVNRAPKQANSVKCANFRSRPCPLSGSSPPRWKILSKSSLTQPLMAPDTEPGNKEFPQINSIFSTSKLVQIRIRFLVLSITERLNAPAEF